LLIFYFVKNCSEMGVLYFYKTLVKISLCKYIKIFCIKKHLIL